MAAAQRLALDVEALALPVVCLGCDAPLPARHEAEVCCGLCRSRMDRIAPPACRRCGQPIDRWESEQGRRRVVGRGACGFCREWPVELGWARSAVWIEEGPARRLVHALKYGGWRCAAGPMAVMMAQECGAALQEVDALVPVPLGRGRRRERGHNQAEELAGALASLLGLAMPADALARTSETRTQTRLDPEGRKRNVAGAFQGVPGHLSGKRVALVDDVLTTGATLAAAAQALAAAGATSIGAVTFARALVPS